MKTLDEIYEELQNGNNEELNVAWQEAKKESEKARKITLSICLIIDIIAIIILLGRGTNFASIMMLLHIIMLILIINLFVFVIVKIIFSKKQVQYNQTYKKIVMTKLINNFYDNSEYFPQKPMPEYIYRNLEYEHYDKYKSEDYFEGYIDKKYGVQMAEVLTQEEEEYKDSDGNTHTRLITKFHGLFTKILMEKSIKSKIQIMQNGAILFDNRLKMDSSEFEKHFDVKASDKIIGMQLLTADVMEQLVEFENKTKMKFDICIENNELFLRFHSGEMFEAGKLKNGTLDKNTIQKYFYMLNFTYNLSNKLISIVNDIEI